MLSSIFQRVVFVLFADFLPVFISTFFVTIFLRFWIVNYFAPMDSLSLFRIREPWTVEALGKDENIEDGEISTELVLLDFPAARNISSEHILLKVSQCIKCTIKVSQR